MRFYRSFFPLFHFSQNFTFPKKIPFCHFYPQIRVSTCTSTDRFFHFFTFPKISLFPKKNPFCHFYPQTTIPPSLLQIVFCTFSLFPKKIHFVNSSFLPTNNNTPSTSTDHFLHFFTFPKKLFHFSPKKIPFCQFYPSFYRSFFPLFHFSQKWYTFYWFENFHELSKIPILRLLDEIPFVLVHY